MVVWIIHVSPVMMQLYMYTWSVYSWYNYSVYEICFPMIIHITYLIVSSTMSKDWTNTLVVQPRHYVELIQELICPTTSIHHIQNNVTCSKMIQWEPIDSGYHNYGCIYTYISCTWYEMNCSVVCFSYGELSL